MTYLCAPDKLSGMIISVDGNIGSGKSTVLARLAADGMRVFAEPVEHWTLIDKFYEDRRKYALAFNLEVLASFSRVEHGSGTVITERSPLTSRDVFARMLVNDGVMSDAEWEVFKKYYDLIGWEPDAVLYIEAPAAVCYERMHKRGRACERSVELEYLERLERAHDTLLRFTKAPVVRIDGTQSEEAIYEQVVAAIRTLSG